MTETSELNDFNAAIVDEFRANGGKVGGPFEGGTLLLLHTTGAKSGKPRLSPLAYLTIDGRTIIMGSYAGGPKDPAWVHNLRANPRAHIEVGTDAYDVTVRELPLDERRGSVRRRSPGRPLSSRCGSARAPGCVRSAHPLLRAPPRRHHPRRAGDRTRR